MRAQELKETKMQRIIDRIVGGSILGIFALTLTVSARADDASSQLYQRKCVVCHAADGSGSEGGKKMGTHDFRSSQVQSQSDADLSAIIAKGKNKMPAYEKSLKPDEIKGLVAYMHGLGKK
jgi:mono/diheme cytochrome c family protein